MIPEQYQRKQQRKADSLRSMRTWLNWAGHKPTESDIAAQVEGTVGSGPGEFSDLLADPVFDERAEGKP